MNNQYNHQQGHALTNGHKITLSRKQIARLRRFERTHIKPFHILIVIYAVIVAVGLL